MDVEGYVPINMLFAFPQIGGVVTEAAPLMEMLAGSQVVDVDTKNEKIRARVGWQAVRGFGVLMFVLCDVATLTPEGCCCCFCCSGCTPRLMAPWVCLCMLRLHPQRRHHPLRLSPVARHQHRRRGLRSSTTLLRRSLCPSHRLPVRHPF